MSQPPPPPPAPDPSDRPEHPADHRDAHDDRDTCHRREVRDWRGRRYVLGPSARTLTGLPRGVILARALAAVAAVGVLQFGYGTAAPVLVDAHGWSPATALAPFLAWTLAQGACAPVLHRLRTRRWTAPGTAVPAGAVLCAAALASLGHATTPLAVLLGYGILGGVGAGLVYHSCVALVSGWFPDRRTVRSGAVGCAFALGAVPLVPAIAVGLSPASLAPACTALALTVLAVGASAGLGQRSAPPHWWPPGSDPRARSVHTSADPPAAADFTPSQAWGTGRSLPTLHAVVALSGAAALFTLAALPVVLLTGAYSPAAAGAAVAVFTAASGLGRLAADTAAARFGRRPTLTALLAAGALAQAGLAAALSAGQPWLLVPPLLLTGASAGSAYPLTRAIAEDHFGSRDAAGIQSLVYGAKAVGGLLGAGGAVWALAQAPAHTGAAGFTAAGLALAAAAVLSAGLRRPLPVRTLPVSGGAWTATRRRAPM